MSATDLYAAADRIEGHAATLRSRAAVIGVQRDTMRWQSLAARLCRTRIDDVTAALSAWAGQADTVAHLLRREARRVASMP
ncbi:MAG: hypothetical protein ACRDVG_11640 [Jatrophihabitantaceae bacterium]